MSDLPPELEKDLQAAIRGFRFSRTQHEIVCNFVRPLLQRQQAEIERLKAIVAKLPHTADGVAVLPGVTILCPKGHPHEIRPSGNFGGRIYCCEGECWSDGCQGDSGSGTHYDAAQCTNRGH